MTMYNTLNGSQPNTRTFKIFSPVETLEYAKQFLYISHIKADPIVFNKNDDLVLFSVVVSYLNLRPLSCACEFNRVRNKVNQRKSQHRAVSIQIGQCPDFPPNLPSICLLLYFAHCFFNKLVQADHCLFRLSTSYS